MRKPLKDDFSVDTFIKLYANTDYSGYCNIILDDEHRPGDVIGNDIILNEVSIRIFSPWKHDCDTFYHKGDCVVGFNLDCAVLIRSSRDLSKYNYELIDDYIWKNRKYLLK